MLLDRGRRVGVYEIVSLLGEGGMGQVYRAHDPTLGRDVAIKVLPDLFAHDGERVARFTREAQALAALNHPNIAQIYGVVEAPAAVAAHVHALVMELVDGEDLAERLRRGPLPLDEAVAIARQIADALEAAHEHGIVHRDLKPANVKVRADGTVKVLDFGLAKAIEGGTGTASGDLTNSPTLTVRGTQAGVILGTAGYMAPEQARGRPVDRRADIWAFGVILHEMLTGKPLFDGETVSDVLAAVLTRSPDLRALPPATPAPVRHLIARCLDRDPKLRLRDIGEARVALSQPDLSSAAAPQETTGSAARRPRGLAWSVVVLALALLASGGALWRATRPVPGPVVRYDVAAPEGSTLGLSSRSAVGISRDGSLLVFAAAGADGTSRLYLHRRDEAESRALPGTEGASSPEFSPDGRWIAFTTAGGVKKTSLDGTTINLAAPTDKADNRGLTWIDNDNLVAALEPAGPLFLISGADARPRALTTVDAAKGERSHRWPLALPGGKAVLFTVGTLSSPDNYDDCAVDAVTIATGERRRVLQGASYVRYAPTGHLIYAHGGTLFAVPFDAERLAVTGKAVPVQRGVSGDITTGSAHVSLADDGTMAFIPGSAAGASNRLVWASIDARAVTPIPLGQGIYYDPKLSPDGSRVALIKVEGGARDVYVYDLVRTTSTRISFEGGAMAPAWSADGRLVYWSAVRAAGNETRITRRPADGSRDPEVVATVPGRVYTEQVLDAGKWALVTAIRTATSTGDVGRLELVQGAAISPLVATTADEYSPAISPNGRWLAYQSNESGRYEVYVRDLSVGGGRWQVSVNGGEEPRWSSDRQLFYRRDTTLFGVSVTPGASFTPGSPRQILQGIYDLRSDTGASYDIDPKTGRFLMLRPDSDARPPSGVRIVLNWFQELRRLTSD